MGNQQRDAEAAAAKAAAEKAQEEEAKAKAAAETDAKAKADAEAAAAKAEPRSTYHVVGPGSLQFHGEIHGAGSLLELTAEEAKELGETVKSGAPVPVEVVARRRGGLYRVAGPGSVTLGGKMHEAGAVLELSSADAKSLGGAVVPEAI